MYFFYFNFSIYLNDEYLSFSMNITTDTLNVIDENVKAGFDHEIINKIKIGKSQI